MKTRILALFLFLSLLYGFLDTVHFGRLKGIAVINYLTVNTTDNSV